MSELTDPSNLCRKCLVTEHTSKPKDKYLVIIGGTDHFYLVSGFVKDRYTHTGRGVKLEFGSQGSKTSCRWMGPDEIIWVDDLHEIKTKDNLFNINDL